jgi:AcrR family transcriptional regulator
LQKNKSTLQENKAKAAARASAPKAHRRRGTRRQRRSTEDIVNRIVQAAHSEFKQSGFAGTTTAQIARRADVTEAQLFQYFGSKANLFRETIFKPLDEQLRRFMDNHIPELGKTASLGEMAHLYTSELQRFVSDNSEMLTSLVVAQTYDEGNGHGVAKINSLSTYFERGASTMIKRLRANPKVDPKLMVRVSFAAVLGCIMFKDWIFPRGIASDEDVTAAINDFVLEGIGANSHE